MDRHDHRKSASLPPHRCEQFDGLIDEYLRRFWRDNPVAATAAGIHDYDHLLTDFEPDAVEQRRRDAERFAAAFEACRADDAERKLDRRLAVSMLRVHLAMEQQRPGWRINPSLYINTANGGIHIATVRDYAPADERAESIIRRLEAFGRLFQQARRNLDEQTPRQFCLTAISQAGGVVGFLTGGLVRWAEQSLKPAQAERLVRAATRAVEQVHGFAEFLRKRLLGRCHGNFAVGRELFELLLREQHGLEYDAATIAEMGRAHIAETISQMKRLCRELGEDDDWPTLLEKLKDQHPQPERLGEVYRQRLQQAIEFVNERQLVTIPADAPLEVVPTPVFARPTYPIAGYMPPAPFERQKRGFIWVTPVETANRNALREHSYAAVPLLVAHEGVPGHHLQLCTAYRHPRPLRRVAGSSLFVEGWALYCEMLMTETGFCDSPWSRLLQLRNTLWRACRMVIDPGLHVLGTSPAEAVEMLMQTVRMGRASAEGEVRRYCMTPTQPLTYLLGRETIIAIRKEAESRLGEAFSLKRFHDYLLSFGSIPPRLIPPMQS